MCDHRLEAMACSKCEYQTKIPKLLHSEPSRQSFVGDTFTISQVLNLCSPRLLLFHETLSDNMGTAHIVDMSGTPSQEITWCLILVSNCLLWMTTKSFHFQVVTNMESSAGIVYDQLTYSVFDNYSSNLNGLWVNSYWLRGHEGERNNCFSKIQLVCQKYRE